MTEPLFKRFSGTEVFPESLHNCVVAIGNFDGVHRGHQAVLERALELAHENSLPAVVLTFEPHPRSFFKPDGPVERLTDATEKAQILRLMGFDAVVEQPFTAEFSQQSAEDFVQHILVEKLHANCVVAGYDFHFGKGRRGTPEFLQNAGDTSGISVSLVDAFSDEGGNLVSSTRIRALLCEGEAAQAAGLLGYRYRVSGEIIHGKKLGRTLGFPTANMGIDGHVSLKYGIYAVRFRRADGALYDGVASLGRRPTVDSDGVPLLETFLFDFSGDLYGEVATVSFFGFLRGEVKFDGLDPLVEQMKRDEEEARALLAGARPLSELDRILSFQSA
ncbi:bifunctional riboflavin kinase/FAD synthetase [Falsochrobactrum sp. TDYN1]|uniref:Riboflavin biosynthesis protein n=1 Tax=Falsochrobactrum tianjinense TaxID=2706015 RepID=A0A949PMK1_9HYPH|nr:bifunctional riboflavin kinase/FAD synthetase [Falsochrobactrum sp. TDYN1]MBV2143080.1 bifunctional riboflavin kinase/FAD synthetase [Falsochrobactrum sp. TDYN1]